LPAFLSERRSKKLTQTNNNLTVPAADFDWSMDKEGFSRYSPAEQETLSGLYEKTLSTIAEKEIVKATVVGFTEKEVVLNIGFKSDGLIQRTEFRDTPDLKIGDVVEVLLENKEDMNGQLVLSRKKAVSERAWENIMKAQENDEIVNGYVLTRSYQVHKLTLNLLKITMCTWDKQCHLKW
jgi:small subunit ribosomal protein S1